MAEEQKNQPEKVRKIIDHAQLHQITEKLFCRFPIHIIENNQKNAARILGYENPHLEITHQLPPGQGRTLLLEKDDHSMMLECNVVRRTESGSEILKPLRLFVTKRGIRQEARTAITGVGNLAGVVTNCIPHPEFYKTNASSNPGRDTMFAQYISAVRELLPETQVKIELQRHNRLTVRMKKLHDFDLPVFAPRMDEQRQGDDLKLIAMPYTEYEQVMRSDALPGDYIGEICEPIRYRGVFMLGYVQVLSLRAPLNISQYHSVRQLTRRLEADMEKRAVFPTNPVVGKIIDVSNSGIGFNYSAQRNILSSAEVGDKIVFDARFTAENATTFSGRIMNINTAESAMRFGIEFQNLSEANHAALKQFLDSKS